MSDAKEEAVEAAQDAYQEREDAELDQLKQQMQFGDRARYGGYQYVGEPEPGYDVPGVWTCHFANSRSGYAHVGHGIAYAVHDALKLPHQLIPHRMRGVVVDEVPGDRREDVQRWMGGGVGLGRVLIVTLPPPGAAQMNGYGRTRIVCYATHECDRVSGTCAEICNPGPDQGGFAQIWVKTEFAHRAFVAGGVRPERLRLVEPPLIGGPWKVPTPADRAARREKQGPTFRFGMLGTWIARKGFEDLLHAYYAYFTRADDVVLEIKTSPLDEVSSIREMTELLAAAAARVREQVGIAHENRPRVIFHIGTEQTDQQVIDWVSGLDAFANSSYGEGLGIPQIYAMAAGVPLITTDFGAVGELATWHLQTHTQTNTAQPHVVIPHTPERIGREMLRVSRMYDPGQRWGVFDIHEFGHAMRSAFERGIAANNNPAANVTGLRERFSFESAGQKLREAIGDLVDLNEFA